MESIRQLRSHVLERVVELGAPPALVFRIELVLEELLTNVVRYAYPGGEGEVEIECCLLQDRKLHLTIRDWGTPFDPLDREDPDITQSLCERPIGGLGVFLVRQYACDLTYDRQAEMNVLTLCFQL